MATSIFQLADALSRSLYFLLKAEEPPPCLCDTIAQEHGGTFHPECPLHHKQATVLNPREKRERSISFINSTAD